MKRISIYPVLCAVIAGLPLAAACEEEKDDAETVARKAECRQLEDHIFRITPQPGTEHGETDPAKLAALMAKVPAEDIEQCAVVKDRKVIACMQAAPDVAAVRACIPPER